MRRQEKGGETSSEDESTYSYLAARCSVLTAPGRSKVIQHTIIAVSLGERVSDESLGRVRPNSLPFGWTDMRGREERLVSGEHSFP